LGPYRTRFWCHTEPASLSGVAWVARGELLPLGGHRAAEQRWLRHQHGATPAPVVYCARALPSRSTRTAQMLCLSLHRFSLNAKGGCRREEASTDTPGFYFCTVMVAPVMGRPLTVGLP
jgi:hypothetical protein